MSRRPATTGRPTGLSRAVSTASIAMPPPSRIPGRPQSSMSTTASNVPLPESRPTSPRKTSVVKRTGQLNASRSKEAEGGEINIQVVVRCRGRSPQELATTSPIITKTEGPLAKSITIETTPMATSSSLATFTTASSYGGSGAPSTKTYPFDKVFGPEADQAMVFDEVAEGMLDEVLSGYNCTIFAYGQTGTGKTYTMQGDLELSALSAPTDSAGIVPRVLHRLFALLEAAANTEFSVKCSYVELYNEELRDLLSVEYGANGSTTSAAGGGLKLYEDGKKGTMIQGLEEVGVKNLREALAVVNKGCQKRQVAETKMNTESSRSHTILSITVHIKETGVATHGEDLLKVGKFNLVDLAGSEAIGRSGATDKRAREAGMINQSLLTLGRVISALVEKGPHIPYRESKLTRLLQDSLGGKTKTCIVATVSPTRSNMEETLSTLDYAIRAKSIRNRPEVNQHLTKTGLLKEYLGDIERLKSEVLAAREKNGVYIPEEQWKEMQDDLAKQKSDYEEAKLRANAAGVELATKKRAFDELCTKMLATAEELALAREAEKQLGLLVEEVKVELEVSRERLEEEKVVAEAYERGEERLDNVAIGLRSVATESVGDVGGLFDKLARKAKVLGSNADAATRFGADLQGLSKDLRHGLQKMSSMQAELGRQLQSEMSIHAQKGQEISQKDLSSLESSFNAFTALAQTLSSSVSSQTVEWASSSRNLLAIKEQVQQSVQEWALQINQRNTSLVEDVLAHQQEHLSLVESVMGSTADLVDAVIATARQHVREEREAGDKSRQLAVDTANDEMSRLRAQNALLARMLADEKSKTKRLRSELISNLTSLITDFTDTQDESWSAAVADVQSGNEAAAVGMQNFVAGTEQAWHSGTKRKAELDEELDMALGTSSKQREAAHTALGEVKTGVRERLIENGHEAGQELEQTSRALDQQLGLFDHEISGAAARIKEQGQTHAGYITEMSDNIAQTHASSASRISSMTQDIATLTSTLLHTHAKTSKSFDKSHAHASSSLVSLIDRTAHFVSSEIQEDVPTGITPRKKVWNVTTDWERTEPREALIAAMRRGEPSTLSTSSSTVDSISEVSPVEVVGHSEVKRTVSMGSDTENHIVALPPVSLSTSQMKPPKKLDLAGKGRRGEEQRGMVPLTEGGANIPRRTRK